MAQFRCYHPDALPSIGSAFTLNKEESHHLVTVLRARKSDEIMVFDGKGGAWSCQLIDLHPKKTTLSLLKALPKQTEPRYPVILAQALPKGKCMDTVIRQATETGVSQILPLHTRYSPFSLSKNAGTLPTKYARWQSIAVEACKQSGNRIIPQIANIQSLEEFLKQLPEKMPHALKLIASLQPEAKPLFEILDPPPQPRPILCLIGPEGDFSEDEYEEARKHGFHALSLSKHVLRVETAVIYALSILDYEIQKWGNATP